MPGTYFAAIWWKADVKNQIEGCYNFLTRQELNEGGAIKQYWKSVTLSTLTMKPIMVNKNPPTTCLSQTNEYACHRRSACVNIVVWRTCREGYSLGDHIRQVIDSAHSIVVHSWHQLMLKKLIVGASLSYQQHHALA